MARVLVTGGAGFIGSHLVDALVVAGHDVVVFDNFSWGHEENLQSPDIEIVRGDIQQMAEFKNQIGEVDTVFHLAALISAHDSMAEPDEYLDCNLRGTLRVLETVGGDHRPHVVFASTSGIYGTRRLCHEEDLPNPLTPYAISKLACEHLLAMYSERIGFSYTSLRLFNVYGPRQSPDHPYANVTCKFVHAAANDLPVKLFGDGEQSRDFVYVTDVVHAMMEAMQKPQRTLYNVGSGQSRSILELIGIINSIAKKPLEVERLPPWPNDIESICASTLHTDALLGRGFVELREGLKQTLGYFQSN